MTLKLTASDEDAMDFFGYYMSGSGNTAVIRSSGDDNDKGSAYVFQHSDSNGWIQVAKLTASDGAVDDHFGESVSVSGSTAVIGSRSSLVNPSDSGSAYVFQYSDSNGWMQVVKLTTSDGAESDLFGFSASVSDNTAVIGSVGDDDNGLVL
ncbi:hypothetical protein ACHAXN_005639 [Cyclotella atomus]